MLKKVFGWTVFLALAAVLVYGAAYRTLARARTGNGEVAGHSVSEGGWASAGQPGSGGRRMTERQGAGSDAATGYRAGRAAGSTYLAESQKVAAEWISLQGVVSSLDDAQLVIALDQGGELVVEGRAWSYAQQSGFELQVGDALTLGGYWEGDAFKTSNLDNLTSGQSIQLRDQSGRPAWAGGGGWG